MQFFTRLLLVLPIENDEVGKNKEVLRLLFELLKKYSKVKILIIDNEQG
ncbi:hypothetical protein RV14_GL000560 [Enterococcus ratti]|uniref:Uncharacterized protein n=1 Tax=Enterococcus ratti TaxID=150033 RepID=A0A1L8WHL1_9ENTE|nr:hypothetical protein RV14_GL000560 [Enterococcus ratti]